MIPSILVGFFFLALGMAFTETNDAAYPHYASPGNKLNQIDGGTIASATLIAPAGYVTRVSGVAAIDTVQLPYDGFQGTIVLVPTGIWSLTTNGNVKIAVTAVVSKALHLTIGQEGKWYPVYLS